MSLFPAISGDELTDLRTENARLKAILDAPEIHDFARGVVLEAMPIRFSPMRTR